MTGLVVTWTSAWLLALALLFKVLCQSFLLLARHCQVSDPVWGQVLICILSVSNCLWKASLHSMTLSCFLMHISLKIETFIVSNCSGLYNCVVHFS